MASKTPDSTPSSTAFMASLLGTSLSFIAMVYGIIGAFAPSGDTMFRIASGVFAIITAAATIYFLRKMFQITVNT